MVNSTRLSEGEQVIIRRFYEFQQRPERARCHWSELYPDHVKDLLTTSFTLPARSLLSVRSISPFGVNGKPLELASLHINETIDRLIKAAFIIRIPYSPDFVNFLFANGVGMDAISRKPTRVLYLARRYDDIENMVKEDYIKSDAAKQQRLTRKAIRDAIKAARDAKVQDKSAENQ